MSRKLDDLDPVFKPFAMELIARCVEAGIAVMIVETARTQEEHLVQVAAGVSWTEHSKHVPADNLHGALAIDLAPYETYQLHGPDKLKWDGSDPAWQIMGVIGERLGLRWGGRWQQKDMGHFEYMTTTPLLRTGRVA